MSDVIGRKPATQRQDELHTTDPYQFFPGRIQTLIAGAKDEHHPGWRERHTEPAPLPVGATPMQTMAHRLRIASGKVVHALRKQTAEPVFGIIKSVMGFRQFLLRGLAKVSGEWDLVCLVSNIKRIGRIASKIWIAGESTGENRKTLRIPTELPAC